MGFAVVTGGASSPPPLLSPQPASMLASAANSPLLERSPMRPRSFGPSSPVLGRLERVERLPNSHAAMDVSFFRSGVSWARRHSPGPRSGAGGKAPARGVGRKEPEDAARPARARSTARSARPWAVFELLPPYTGPGRPAR